MALFNQSTIQWNTAVRTIADSIGASADTEMLNRAHRSLRASFQFLGGRHRWDFLRAEAAPQQVVAPFQVTGVSASAGQVSAACPAGHGLAVDDLVQGTYFLLGTRVTATAAAGFGVSTTSLATAAGDNVFDVTAVRDMYAAPTDMRNGYGVKLLSSQKPLSYRGRRAWDRIITDELAPGTPESYDFFVLGAKSKIRLLPPPNYADVLQQRYYRRFTLASASSVTSALDIPEDYEEVPMAWAKWHFLTDKGEGRKDQATTWMSLAQDGLKQMLMEQTSIPDENLTILPGHTSWSVGDNSTRWLEWNYS